MGCCVVLDCNREELSEGPIFLYCWSEGVGVKTVSTEMSRVRQGLRMASPAESKWCSIMINSAPDQAGARVWGFPTREESPGVEMTFLERRTVRQESRLTLETFATDQTVGLEKWSRFLDTRLEGFRVMGERRRREQV